MITPKSASEQLLFSSVRIEAIGSNGSQSVGTEFFFSYRIDDQRNLPVIITNKHVIAGAQSGRICFHEAEHAEEGIKPSGKYLRILLNDFETRWLLHPAEEIDLCAMFINPITSEVKSSLGKEIYTMALDETLIQSDTQLENLSAVEDILMFGYPIGLWDSVNNPPIIRRGITASHPALDFEGKSITVIDGLVFRDLQDLRSSLLMKVVTAQKMDLL
ncbi:MAG: hypothetical protein ABI947_08930 [Chloroflexota bacterium]